MADTSVSTNELSVAAEANRQRVEEFKKVAEIAERRGLRVYLFGGTASTYLHYVRKNLLKQKGDTQFQNVRSDYELSTMFFENQDLDLVVTRKDGSYESASEIKSFQDEVRRKLSSHRGKTISWEVRGLKTSHGTKLRLEGEFDFLNQNSDSHSVGLVELTDSNEAKVRDLRGGQFLNDSAAGEIHYYRSGNHQSTSRARSGDNPEILSAIRILSKAFQFGLKIPKESQDAIREVVNQFRSTSGFSDFAKKKVEFEATKLFSHSQDLSRSYRETKELGLFSKLSLIGGTPSKLGSLAWYLEKEPLNNSDVTGREHYGGLRARHIGLTYVTHSTPTFENFLSITASPTGRPNALISRSYRGTSEEVAAYGDGYYTMNGTKGMSRRGLRHYEIVHEVDPDAIEGIDFTRHGDIIVWKNSSKLKVVTRRIEGTHFSEGICLRAMRALGFGNHRWAAVKHQMSDPRMKVLTGLATLASVWIGVKHKDDFMKLLEKDEASICEKKGGGFWIHQYDEANKTVLSTFGCFCERLQTYFDPEKENCRSPQFAKRIYEQRVKELEPLIAILKERDTRDHLDYSYDYMPSDYLSKNLKGIQERAPNFDVVETLDENAYKDIDSLRVDILQTKLFRLPPKGAR